MDDINNLVGFIKALEKHNFIELKASPEQLEILAHKYLTFQDVNF